MILPELFWHSPCHDDNPRQSRDGSSVFQEEGHEAKPFYILIACALGAGEGKLRVLYAICQRDLTLPDRALLTSVSSLTPRTPPYKW